MLHEGKIWMAKDGERDLFLLPHMANRHGLIAGATGTGKTITMKVMAESFSDMGVPVFFSDVKGDLSGMCMPGADSEDMQRRIKTFGIRNFEYKSYPTHFWDLFGEKGHSVRVSVSGLGPMLLARLLNLTDVQEGVLNITFKVADDRGLLLIDMKDLRAMLQYVADNRDEYTIMYGNVASFSVGAIQRALLAFEQEGGVGMFGEPELDVKDWIRTDTSGRGVINVLSAQRLFQSPLTYATFLLWMLTELYENLPEVGDVDKPRIVFFFDEAHCLFDDTPKALHQKITQIIRLIRSKGVGVFFVTQNPADIPSDVLGQLGNKIQHGLRAYTPAELKGVRAAAQSFRENEDFDTEEALQALGTGEALVSFLDEKGVPEVVRSARILPPQSLMGPAPAEEVDRLIKTGEFDLKYRECVDRESAYEIIVEAGRVLKKDQESEEEAADGQENATSDAARSAKTTTAEAAAAGDEDEAVNTDGMTMTEKKAAEIAARKKKAAKTARSAVTNATSSVARSLSTNIVNTITGSGRVADAATIGKRAATNALSSVMRSGATSIVRGLFGNITK
ncbi:MAG: helicase HerA-like domain-containing protein [Lachnospiraceae bacterium]|jgi:DNA helicase HerA-like ATPase